MSIVIEIVSDSYFKFYCRKQSEWPFLSTLIHFLHVNEYMKLVCSIIAIFSNFFRNIFKIKELFIIQLRVLIALFYSLASYPRDYSLSTFHYCFRPSASSNNEMSRVNNPWYRMWNCRIKPYYSISTKHYHPSAYGLGW